jgi:hypothetical protein
MADDAYIAELQQRSRELQELWDQRHPPPQRVSAADQLYSLRSYPAEGDGPVVGADPFGSYTAAGVTDADAIEFCQALHIQPALAAQFIATLNSEKDAESYRPDQRLSRGRNIPIRRRDAA